MAKKKSIVNMWSISIAVLALLIVLVIVFSNVPSGSFPTNSIGYLSIGDSEGLIITERGRDLKTLSIVPECSPDSGYTDCFQYENINNWEGAQARAYVKIQGSDSSVQNPKEGYYVGQVAIPVKFVGDKFYVYENFGTWNNLWDNIARCDKDGCKNAKKIISQEDTYVLAETGQEYHGCPAFVAFDFDCDGDCFNDYSSEPWVWSWTTGGWGWAGDNNCLNIKSVECFDATDCSSTEYCDKSGTWQTWSCKTKECSTDSDCANLNTESEPYCSNSDSYKVVTTSICSQSNYKCVGTDNPTLNDECFLGCSESAGICNEKTTVFIVGIIVVILIGVGITLYLVYGRKHRRRR